MQPIFTLRQGCAHMDFAAVTALLRDTYWAAEITTEVVLKGAENSALVMGAFVGERQIGFCRVISDKTRFAYLLDVVVHKDFRGRGVGKSMVSACLEHESLKDVNQWNLKTKDAHEFYKSFGFAPTTRKLDILEIIKPR